MFGTNVEDDITGTQKRFATKEIGLIVEVVMLQLVLVMTGANWLEDRIGKVLSAICFRGICCSMS